MTTTPIKSSGAQSKDQTSNKFSLKSEDFIKMMITQLQNQDPLSPAKNEELLSQMSQIGQLQSQTQLTTSLQGMVLQNSLGAAGNLIGKSVQGLDDKSDPVSGLVNSVRVEDSSVFLELDNGKTLGLDKVTAISPGPTAKAPAPTTPA